MKKKWVVYCSGNAAYVLSPNKEPIRMLKSFQTYFGDELDYVYFTDETEERLDEVRAICEANGIKLILGECRKHYEEYQDSQFAGRGLPQRWPDAHYWYCEAPKYLRHAYSYAIKCDGDMLCLKHFDLESLESDFVITAALSPIWHTPYDKFCPNAGFQLINLSKYVDEGVFEHFREASKNYRRFNGDTPALNYFVGSRTLRVNFLPSDYNYLLFDDPAIHKLTLEDFKTVNIIHFVSSKPHNLEESMKGTVKEHFAKIYLGY